jgi:hypothetical protein
MGLQTVAVLALGGHRDLGLQLTHQRQLRAMGLVEVLDDLLLLLLTQKSQLRFDGVVKCLEVWG